MNPNPTEARPSVVLADIQAAAAVLASAVDVTPCLHSETLSAITGADVWCKYENLQYTASFKERGARWFLESLDEEARTRGVLAASAGNHAQGVARHARLLGIAATIVMPESTPFTKITRTEYEGATVIVHGADFAEAYRRAIEIAEEQGATFVPAFDHPRIIAGQGTVGLEILDQVADLDVVVVPVGGGGLLAGIAVAVKALQPSVRVVGVQSETHPYFARAVGSDAPIVAATTIAEGIAVPNPGAATVAVARDLVDEILVVEESTIEAAVALMLDVEKTVVEGAAAAPLAALLEHPQAFAGRRCALVVSGGNIDPRTLSAVLLRALAREGRLVLYRCRIPDRPGQLASIAAIIAAARGNVVDVEHHRDRPGVAVRDAILEVSVETRDRNHADAIAHALIAAGIELLP